MLDFKVVKTERKTSFLTPSGLRCLSGLPTINISSGFVHGCIYCYIKGYSRFPGNKAVEVYENMASCIQGEIKRKRKKASSVYFCPSCDSFQPVEEIQKASFDVMKILLESV